jgi:hypothetical protein
MPDFIDFNRFGPETRPIEESLVDPSELMQGDYYLQKEEDGTLRFVRIAGLFNDEEDQLLHAIFFYEKKPRAAEWTNTLLEWHKAAYAGNKNFSETMAVVTAKIERDNDGDVKLSSQKAADDLHAVWQRLPEGAEARHYRDGPSTERAGRVDRNASTKYYSGIQGLQAGGKRRTRKNAKKSRKTRKGGKSGRRHHKTRK